MSAAKHTPGPWHVQVIGGLRVSAMSCTFPVADIVPHADDKADARLIAAAPELLAACERVLVRLENRSSFTGPGLTNEMSGILADAIAKARGGQ